MIRTSSAKRLVAQLLAVVLAVIVVGTLVLMGRFVTDRLTGAKAAQALHEIPELPEGVAHLARWLPDRWTRERVLEPGTRRQIESAYLQGWAALGRYGDTGDRDEIVQRFAGPARAQAMSLPSSGSRTVWGVGHRLELTFYALDGATVGLRDIGATVVRRLSVEGLHTVVVARESYEVVLTLEDGYWRIRQFRRTDSRPVLTVAAPTTSWEGLPTDGLIADGVSTAAAGRPVERFRAARLEVSWSVPRPPERGLPQGIPAQFDREAVVRQLSTLRSLGFDMVRLDVPELALGKVPDAVSLATVGELLDVVAQQGLRAVVVLDGSAAARGPDAWSQNERRLRALVEGLRQHPAVALWDLSDAPDAAASDVVLTSAWLLHASALVRTLDPRTPVTIGWSTARAAALAPLARAVDVVTLPWAQDPEDLAAWLGTTRAAAGARPLVLAPVSDSWTGLMPHGRTEREQARWAADVVSVAVRHGVTNVLVNRVTDASGGLFGPRSAAGGLLRADGTVKPVADALRSGRAPRVVGALEAARKPFWWVMLVTVLLSIPGVPSRLRRAIGAGASAAARRVLGGLRRARRPRGRPG